MKVLGILKGLFQKSLKRVQGSALPLPYKPKLAAKKGLPEGNPFERFSITDRA